MILTFSCYVGKSVLICRWPNLKKPELPKFKSRTETFFLSIFNIVKRCLLEKIFAKFCMKKEVSPKYGWYVVNQPKKLEKFWLVTSRTDTCIKCVSDIFCLLRFSFLNFHFCVGNVCRSYMPGIQPITVRFSPCINYVSHTSR